MFKQQANSSDSEITIMQTWVQNYDNPQLQSLEAGWTVDQSLNGDWLPHLFTYYTTNDYSQDGDFLGGYNLGTWPRKRPSSTDWPSVANWRRLLPHRSPADACPTSPHLLDGR
jgi:Neprosin